MDARLISIRFRSIFFIPIIWRSQRLYVSLQAECDIMKKNNALKRLSVTKAPLMAIGVSQLGLFGSTARGENTSKSDIDILIDFESGQETYRNFMDACSILQNAFGKVKLDIVTKKGLSPYIGATILNEVEYV